MYLSRRTFLFGATAAGAMMCRADGRDARRPLLRIGVLSDSHVTVDPATAEPLRRIFADFSEKCVDVVMHAGDICHVGDLDELALVADAWRGAFKGGCNASGQKVTPFFAFGNHDYHKASFQRGKSDGPDPGKAIVANKDAAWRLLTGEDFPGEVFSAEVKGYRFVGAHWGHEGEVAGFFASHPMADESKPMFYVQHPHPKGTCFGGWATGVSNANEELMRHRNLFAVSGHSHISCAYDSGLWQGGFVSMGAGSARVPGPGRRADYENGNPHPSQWPSGVFKHMPCVSGGRAWQASVVTVYADRLTIDRYDYLNGESLGAPWEAAFPFVHDAARPYVVARAAEAPQFPADARIAVARKRGKRRPDDVEEDQIHVSVAAALGDGPHARAVSYKFAAVDAKTGKTVLEKPVLQDWISCAEVRAAKRRAWCAFAVDELPKGVALKFAATPLNAAGKPGRALVSGGAASVDQISG